MDLVFDIETVGDDFESLSESQQEYLLRYAEKEQDEITRQSKIDDAKRYLSLYPFTSRVVSIGMMNIDSGKTLILFDGIEEDSWYVENENKKYSGMTETEMLEIFWQQVGKCNRIVTFNGKNFDVPFLTLRSAMVGIRPAKNLLRRPRGAENHIDLLEKFTLKGCIRKFNLDFYCHSFGVESSKSKNITGMEVKELYKAGRIKDIAIYCGEDVRATFELYNIWNEYLSI